MAKLEALPFPSYHILGFPHYDDLSSSLARRAAKRLMPLGASDGGGILLAEASRYPGLVVPLLGQDHYLHGVSAESLLWGILGVLEESHVGNAVSQTNS